MFSIRIDLQVEGHVNNTEELLTYISHYFSTRDGDLAEINGLIKEDFSPNLILKETKPHKYELTLLNNEDFLRN